MTRSRAYLDLHPNGRFTMKLTLPCPMSISEDVRMYLFIPKSEINDS